MDHYIIQDYFTPEAIELIQESEIIGIDGITEHAIVLLSCDFVPYAAMRDGEELIHAGALINCLPCPLFALSDGFHNLFDDGKFEGLWEYGVAKNIGRDIMFQPWGGKNWNVKKALAYLRNYLPGVILEEYDGMYLFKEARDEQ